MLGKCIVATMLVWGPRFVYQLSLKHFLSVRVTYKTHLCI